MTASPTDPSRRSRLPLILILAGAAFLVGLVIIAALAGNGDEPTQGSAMSQGKTVYDSACAGCHGSRGQGYGVPSAPPLDASGTTWQLSPDALHTLVRGGTHEGMPAFGQRLNDAEVDAVVSYIRSWWTDEQQRSQPVTPDSGAHPDS